MWLLPIDCAGLTRAIPPGQYLLPWYASQDEIDALCRLLRTILEGIRCELRLDDAGLNAAAQRGVKARDALVVACLEDRSASFEQASEALRSLGARYSLLQFPLPQESGYGWLEQEIKVPLFEAIGRMVAEEDHPLAPFNIHLLPVLEAAALTTDPIELIELLERTIAHRLKYAEIGVAAPDYLRSLLLVAGKRLAERLLRLSGEDIRTALEVVAHQGKGPADNLRFRAGAAALERVGLARYVSGDLSLGPLARRALEAPILGAVESALPDGVWTEVARTQVRVVRTTSLAPIVEPMSMSMADSGSGRGSEVPIPVDLLDEPTQRVFGGKSEAGQALSVLREVAASSWTVRELPEGAGERLTTTLRWCEEISAQSTNVAEQRMAKVIESLLRLCAARGVDILARQREAIRPLEETLDALGEDWCEPVLAAALFWHSAALINRRQTADDIVQASALVARCLESWQEMPGAERSVCVGYIRLADIAGICDDPERAREWIAKAVDEGRRLNDLGVVAEAAIARGLSFGVERRVDEAESSFREALQLYEQIGHVKGVAMTCRFLARVAVQRRSPVVGRSLLEKASELGPQSEDDLGYVVDLETMGRIELMEGSLELAERSFDEVVRRSESLNVRNTLARGCWELGVTLKRRGATDRAMVNLKRAIEIYEELGMRRMADEVRVSLDGIVGSSAP